MCVKTMGNSLICTWQTSWNYFFRLIFVEIVEKVESFCLIWGYMQYLRNRWLTLRNSFFHKLKFSQTLFWLLLLFAISSLSKTQSLQSSTITSWFLLTLTVQVNPQKEKISAAQQKMVAILNSIYNFGVPSWKNLFIISRTGICVKYFLSFPQKKPVTREIWDKLSVYFSNFEW